MTIDTPWERERQDALRRCQTVWRHENRLSEQEAEHLWSVAMVALSLQDLSTARRVGWTAMNALGDPGRLATDAAHVVWKLFKRMDITGALTLACEYLVGIQTFLLPWEVERMEALGHEAMTRHDPVAAHQLWTAVRAWHREQEKLLGEHLDECRARPASQPEMSSKLEEIIDAQLENLFGEHTERREETPNE